METVITKHPKVQCSVYKPVVDSFGKYASLILTYICEHETLGSAATEFEPADLHSSVQSKR
jgi:hypothetical protein